MTKVKYPSPKLWLNIKYCRLIYNNFKRESVKFQLTAPVPDFDSRYKGVLESILGSIQLKGNLLNMDVIEVAVSYFVYFSKSQAFLDANKRMAVLITGLFLYVHEYELKIAPDHLRDLSLVLSKDTETSMNKSIKLVIPLFKQNLKKVN